MQKEKFTVTATQSYFNDILALKYDVIVNDYSNENKNISKKFIIVLDISGSMNGDAIENAKQSLLKFIKHLHSFNLKDIIFITFNHECNSKNLLGMSIEDIETYINKITAIGGTNFVGVFELLENFVNSNKYLNLAIIFFTDGFDGYKILQHDKYGKPQVIIPYEEQVRALILETSLIKLHNTIEKKSIPTEVHSIGFSSEYDAVLLEKITSIGTVPGTYQYVKQSSNIDQAITTILNIVFDTCVMMDLISLDSKSISSKIYLHNINNNYYTGYLFTDTGLQGLDNNQDHNNKDNKNQEDENKIKNKISVVKVTANSNTEVKIVNLVNVDEIDIDTTQSIEMIINYIKNTILKLTLEVCKDNSKHVMAKAKITKLEEKLNYAKEKVTEFNKLNKKYKSKLETRIERKNLLSLCSEAVVLINKFYNALMNAKFTNDDIATITTMAYKNINDKRFINKMDKRMVFNNDVFKEDNKKINDYLETLNIQDLQKKYTKIIKEYGQCILSINDFTECLEDASCLCLGLEILRPENSIVNPFNIKIKTISTSLISDNAFDEALERILMYDNNSVVKNNFNNNIPNIVIGQSREPINAIFPLYICKENWEIAKIKLKWALGYLATSDKLGYSFQQINSIPFIILIKAMELYNKEKSEYNKNIVNWITQTCMFVIKDFNLENDILEKINNYCTNPETRSKKNIYDNTVFAVQIHCLKLLYEHENKPFVIKDQTNFLYYLYEEELKRNCLIINDKNDIKYILNINTSKYINEFVEKYRLVKFEQTNKNKTYNFEKNILSLLNIDNTKSNSNTIKNQDDTKPETNQTNEQNNNPIGSTVLSESDFELCCIPEQSNKIKSEQFNSEPYKSNSTNNSEYSNRFNNKDNDNILECADNKNTTINKNNIIYQNNNINSEYDKNMDNKDNVNSIKENITDVNKVDYMDYSISNEYAKSIITETKELINNVIYKLDMILNLDNSILYKLITLENIQILAFALQNKITYYKKNEYTDLIANNFSIEACNKFLQDLSIKYVINLRKTQINIFNSQLQKDSIKDKANLFALTKNIYEAAGALLGAKRGYDFMWFVKPLMYAKCPLALKKIKMLYTGKFKGITLVENPGGSVVWNMSKKNRNKLVVNNLHVFKTLAEWDNIFNTKYYSFHIIDLKCRLQPKYKNIE